MHLPSVIIGPVVTEKAERLKAQNTYVLRVHPAATKVEVKHALRKFYDVSVLSIRVLRTNPKRRMAPNGSPLEKRHRAKRVLVTLAKGKTLDLLKFQTS
jgi:large subunit ribosomal protein L23